MDISKDKRILVTGATGKQGGAVARCLLRDGWRVRILTRDPSKPAARLLVDAGAEAVKGDLNDLNSLKSAIAGCYGVYSVQDFYEARADGEVRQGKAVADAAKAANVRHLVYSSVGGADRNTGIPHFDTKYQVEQHVKSIGLPYTIVRPVFFMDNFTLDWFRPGILEGTLSIALRPERTLQLIAVSDIGEIVALAFANPQRYLAKTIELAGDELTMPEVAEKLSTVLGRRVTHKQTPIEQVRAGSPELALMYEWFNAVGYDADIESLRRTLPRLKTFDTFLAESIFAKQPVGIGTST